MIKTTPFEMVFIIRENMIYRRIYKIAMENIKEIADDLLRPVAVRYGNEHAQFWFTIDDKDFTDYQEALDHQIECLMEEIEEE